MVPIYVHAHIHTLVHTYIHNILPSSCCRRESCLECAAQSTYALSQDRKFMFSRGPTHSLAQKPGCQGFHCLSFYLSFYILPDQPPYCTHAFRALGRETFPPECWLFLRRIWKRGQIFLGMHRLQPGGFSVLYTNSLY